MIEVTIRENFNVKRIAKFMDIGEIKKEVNAKLLSERRKKYAGVDRRQLMSMLNYLYEPNEVLSVIDTNAYVRGEKGSYLARKNK